MDMDLELIIQVTKLSKEKIIEIKEQIKEELN